MLGFSKQKRLNKQLMKAAEKGNAVAAEALLNAGAEIEFGCGSNADITPLGHAIIHQHQDVAEMLMRRGAKLDARDRHGDTPLCFALQLKNSALAHLLLDAGAETRIRGFRGRNPLSLAQHMGEPELVQKILQRQAGPVKCDPDEVSFSRPLGNRTLEEIFNFRAQERISLIRLVPQGPVEAITRENFAAVADREQLAAAYVQYKTAGGRIDLPEIFAPRGGAQ